MGSPPWVDPARIVVIGVDPGLVHTGIVRISLLPTLKRLVVDYALVDGIRDTKGYLQVDTDRVMDYVNPGRPDAVFIEGYNPRSHFSTDAAMVAAVSVLSQKLYDSHVINNMGIKKVITKDLMELLGVWKFSTVSHHQDLRAAARIGLLGLVKNDNWNTTLAQLVQDHLNGKDWAHG